ncbi:MAG: fibrobacter succinogenes major paralogous domain-containing protein [Bacteroidales bacterium]|nr:fibrobacter succinogenes major paralogous domain-containing protein [Bacteroidales bacterium]
MKKNPKFPVYLLVLAATVSMLTTGCKKDDESLKVTDVDGNVYNTVQIGSQVWFKENLRATSYNDGTDIPNITGDEDWENTTSGAYCWHDNDLINKGVYGALYNWYAASSGKLCPTGWHVPTNEEMTTLCDKEGGWREAGASLKEDGLTHWKDPNTGATNLSGFTGLPGGYRIVDDYGGAVYWGQLGAYGYWWTSTPYWQTSLNHGYVWEMYFDNTSFSYGSRKKACGFSVRCLKD